MRRGLTAKIAMAGATAALALGAAACEVDDDAIAPGQEEAPLDEGGDQDF